MSSPNNVRWERLRPDDFISRLESCPVIYLPIGLCEPHGHIAPFGLDTLKADYYCDEAAQRFGGIVAPTQGYHIHECGFHRPWLEEVVGEVNPRLGAMPPGVVCYHFLYQLRAFHNAGFRAVVVVSGHSGGSQNDLRSTAAAFTSATGLPVTVKSDPEWVEGLYEGDHAGKYEISQLLAIDPESIDMSLIDRQHDSGSGGRLALGEDAGEASVEYGCEINEAIINSIGDEVGGLNLNISLDDKLDYAATEKIWHDLLSQNGGWFSEQGA
ncbi:MAG: creatinine amidohydrolase [Crocinitomicaceae bacterium]|jgi:creatinine amidohydrolase